MSWNASDLPSNWLNDLRKQWKDLFIAAGIKKRDLQNPATRHVILEVLSHHMTEEQKTSMPALASGFRLESFAALGSVPTSTSATGGGDAPPLLAPPPLVSPPLAPNGGVADYSTVLSNYATSSAADPLGAPARPCVSPRLTIFPAVSLPQEDGGRGCSHG